jgi:hypothetical protein
MKSAQHIIATLSALLLLLASILQSRRSLARAEEKVKVTDKDPDLRGLFLAHETAASVATR